MIARWRASSTEKPKRSRIVLKRIYSKRSSSSASPPSEPTLTLPITPKKQSSISDVVEGASGKSSCGDATPRLRQLLDRLEAKSLRRTKSNLTEAWKGKKDLTVMGRLAKMEADGRIEEELTSLFAAEVGSQKLMSLAQFLSLCTGHLQIDLTEKELERIFMARAFPARALEKPERFRSPQVLGARNIFESSRRVLGSFALRPKASESFLEISAALGPNDLALDCEGFIRVIRRRGFLSSVFTVMQSLTDTTFEPPEDFDFEKPTGGPNGHHTRPDAPFVGDFASIRETRDHAYHGKYTKERQLWQDSVILSVVERTVPQPEPWLVFTCGAMGVGKGYALGWMSSEGIFPLENIVHIDPDHFKKVMPEWKGYVKYAAEHGKQTLPGSMCHVESCYMQEIAFERSMELRQNIWVDGSLRNAEWFRDYIFHDVRSRRPYYKIAIFYIKAPGTIVRERVKERAARTGRDVPEEKIVQSLEAAERSVQILGPLADFLATIDNSGPLPRLQEFQQIDSSGAWSLIRNHFAKTVPGAADFPQCLPPVYLLALRKQGQRSSPDDFSTGPSFWRGEHGANLIPPKGSTFRELLVANASDYRLRHVKLVLGGQFEATSTISPAVALASSSSAADASKHMPASAAYFVWINPTSRTSGDIAMLNDAQLELVTHGGFAYFDESASLLTIRAVTPGAGRMARLFSAPRLSFGPCIAMSKEEVKAIANWRWAKVNALHLAQQGALKFAWVVPQEALGTRRFGANGGFAFAVDDTTPPATKHSRPSAGHYRCVYFPVLSDKY